VPKRVYVGNIPFRMSEEELVAAFSECGKVVGVFIVKDKETGKSKGYAFVEMENEALVKKAITEMNDKLIGGRVIKVSEAIERRDVRK
jgi:RNA recognition motif-containing protein